MVDERFVARWWWLFCIEGRLGAGLIVDERLGVAGLIVDERFVA